MNVGVLAVAVENHDELGGAVKGCDGVWGHGGELGGLAGLDGDVPIAERETHPPFEYEEPVVAGVDALLGNPARWLESHLHGDGRAGGAVQHPDRALAGGAWRGSDDDIVVAANVE